MSHKLSFPLIGKMWESEVWQLNCLACRRRRQQRDCAQGANFNLAICCNTHYLLLTMAAQRQSSTTAATWANWSQREWKGVSREGRKEDHFKVCRFAVVCWAFFPVLFNHFWANKLCTELCVQSEFHSPATSPIVSALLNSEYFAVVLGYTLHFFLVVQRKQRASLNFELFQWRWWWLLWWW